MMNELRLKMDEILKYNNQPTNQQQQQQQETLMYL